MTLFSDPRRGARLRLVRAVSLAVALLSAAGLAALALPPTARAAGDDSSAVTVKWAGDNDPAVQQYQPDRSALVDQDGHDTGSGFWDDFKDLTVTVDRTSDLIDGALTVSYSGMLPTGNVRNNYLSMMQCWGPDPAAADFAETCQWGGWQNSSIGASGAAAIEKQLVGLGLTGTSVLFRNGEPFRAAYGGGFDDSTSHEDRLAFFGAETTNEVPLATARDDGTGSVVFQAQSGLAAPQLGCGTPLDDGQPRRCWLVVVPRSAHSRITASPVDLTYADGLWANRIVVPLDFRLTTGACAAGAAEVGLTGTQLLTTAMSSWQPALCTGAKPAVYNLSTVADSLARSQLLSGQAGLVAVPRPVVGADLADESDQEALAAADIVYAPLAVAAPVVAFNFQTPGGTVQQADITPRLMAKLLTQSFPHQVAGVGAEALSGDWTYEHLHWAPGSDAPRGSLVADAFWQDPDVIAAFHLDDPSSPASKYERNVLPLLQVTGPAGADAIRQLWAWVQADGQARAFLEGQPDERGMTVNPYYLPKDDPKAVVTPVYCVNGVPALWNGQPCIDAQKVLDQAGNPISKAVGLDVNLATDPIDYFPKADETLAPILANTQKGARVDALSFPQFADNYDQIAQRLLRGNPATVSYWDQDAVPYPAFKSAPFQVAGRLISIGIMDAATAAHWDLPTARLQLPDQPGVFAAADTAGLAAGLASQTATGVDGVTTTDMTHLRDGAYPLTQVVYGAVDVDDPGLDQGARTAYADFIRYAATDGQQPGYARGELPPGYQPLTAALARQALAAADRIEAGPVPDPEPTPTPPADTAVPATTGAGSAPSGAGGDGPSSSSSDAGATVTTTASTTTTTTTPPTEAEATGSVAGSIGLGGTLLAGLGGVVGAPLLMRRRQL